MYESIKKMSYSLHLLSTVVRDANFKRELEQSSMSLIKISSLFFIGHSNIFFQKTSLQDLRLILVQVIDLLDLAKVVEVVTKMNAEVIVSAALRLIEEIDRKVHHQESFLLPKFSLSDISDKLLRDRTREQQQEKFFNEKNAETETNIFKMTKIPEPDLFVSELQISGDRNDLKTEVESKDKASRETYEKVGHEKMEPKFSWGNGNNKPTTTSQQQSASQQPLVYTFFGSEDKIIEDRKAKLLEILKIGGGIAIGDIAKQFPGLNSKTLQRDLLDLMREKKVIMLGTKRWAKYYLK